MVIQRTPVKIDKIVSLQIGQRGENQATDIKMDVSDWITIHPDANFYCLFKRPNETNPCPVVSVLEDGILTWTVGAWECVNIGVGYLEVRAVNEDASVVAKSRVIPCSIEDSIIDDEGVVPSNPGWINEVLTAKDTAVAAKDAAELAESNAERSANQAALSSTSASSSASAATTAKNQAQLSADNALAHETNASASETNASQAAISARQSELRASGYATAAETSAGNASASATAAAGSAQDAQDVLDSIPADYSELSDDVSALKSAFTNGYIANSGYLQGFRDHSLRVTQHDARCTMSSIFHLVPGDKLAVENVIDGFQFVFMGVNNGQYVVNSGWITVDTTLDIASEGDYFINIAKGTARTDLITPSDVVLIVKAITQTVYAEKSLVNEVASEVKAVNDKLYNISAETFQYNVGDSLDGANPKMATEKYGIKALTDLESLTLNFGMTLAYSSTLKFEIRDGNNNVYGSVTNQYSAGDVSVDITFTFDEVLSAGQYYFWIFSSVANNMTYGYLSGTFPNFDFIELTPDGGWSGTVDTTIVSSYRMYLKAKIGGVAKVATSKFDDMDVPYERVIKETELAYDSDRDGWLGISSYWTENADGSVTVNNPNTNNIWVNSSWLFDENVLMLDVNVDLTVVSGGLIVFVQGQNSGGSTVYYEAYRTAETGHVSTTVDLAYLSVYTAIDITKPIMILLATNGSSVFTLDNFNVAYNPYSDIGIMGNTLIDTLRNIQNSLVPKEQNMMMVSPSGDKYVLSVTDEGDLSVSPVIPSKVLFLGNSLLIGNGSFGMNASDSAKDYYHYVTNKILEENALATFSKLSGTGFEGCETEAAADTWMTNTLQPVLSNDMELIVVQLGDNVNTAARNEAFVYTCANLLRFIRRQCPRARVVWVGEWYSTAQRQTIIANACTATGCVFIDITDIPANDTKSHLGAVIHRESDTTVTYTVDSYTVSNGTITIRFTVGSTQYTATIPSYTSYTENSATSITVTSIYTVTTNAGVASHPGDEGMLKIANRICYVLGITDSETAIIE